MKVIQGIFPRVSNRANPARSDCLIGIPIKADREFYQANQQMQSRARNF
jgi:hypothetical protein